MSSKEYFNENATKWDEMRTAFFSVAVREEAFRLAHIEKGKIAADIGAGTGFVTEGLLELGVKVIAVDEALNMVEILTEKFKGKDLTVLAGESMNLPIESEGVDYVFANMYLHHVSDPEAAIKEIFRILKPNGKLVITDLFKHQNAFLIEEHHDKWMGFDEVELRNWLSRANLNKIQIKSIEQSCCTCSKDKKYAEIGIFAAFGQKSQITI